jgi:predicted dehydrogenase
MKSVIDRRKFLARSAQAIIMATGAPIVQAAQGRTARETYDLDKLHADTEQEGGTYTEALPPAQRMGIAVVGLGTLTIEEILPALAQCKKIKVTALVTGKRDKGLRLAKEYGVPENSVYSYEDFDKIKDNAEIGAVYIVLPNSMHAEYTIRAARAGKHVLCEKPMANSKAECESMIKACADAGRKLMIAYRIQYEPYNKMVRDLVQEKRYGKTKIIQATNVQNAGDPQHWRYKKALAGGGALPDIGIYCLNTTRFLLGEEPVEVFATIYNTPGDPRFSEVDETMTFQLKFASGTIAICDTSYSAHACRQYRVMCERAWIGMDPAFAYRGLKATISEAKGTAEIVSYPTLPEKNQFALEMDHFATCVLDDKTPDTPGEEGLRDQIIMEALYRSAQDNRPIKL